MNAQYDSQQKCLHQTQLCLEDFPKKSTVVKSSALYALLLFCAVSCIQLVVFNAILPTLQSFPSDLSQAVLLVDGLLVLLLQKRLARRMWKEFCPMPVVTLSGCRQRKA